MAYQPPSPIRLDPRNPTGVVGTWLLIDQVHPTESLDGFAKMTSLEDVSKGEKISQSGRKLGKGQTPREKFKFGDL